MERISRYGAVAVLFLALCFLRSGISDHLKSGSSEILPPNNYFIGLGSLFAGMGIVMSIIAIKTRKPSENDRIITINWNPGHDASVSATLNFNDFKGSSTVVVCDKWRHRYPVVGEECRVISLNKRFMLRQSAWRDVVETIDRQPVNMDEAYAIYLSNSHLLLFSRAWEGIWKRKAMCAAVSARDARYNFFL